MYFYDNGIRNTLLNNFSPLSLRTDKGALFENYLVSERMKFLHYSGQYANRYFWRNQSQQEIDYLEEQDGLIHAFEFKWGDAEKAKLPLTFSNAYPDHSFQLINSTNVDVFLRNQ